MSAPTQLQKKSTFSGDALKSLWINHKPEPCNRYTDEFGNVHKIKKKQNHTEKVLPGLPWFLLCHVGSQICFRMTKMYDDILSVAPGSRVCFPSTRSWRRSRGKRSLPENVETCPGWKRNSETPRGNPRGNPWGNPSGGSSEAPAEWCPEVFLEDEDEWPCPERWNLTMLAVSALHPLHYYVICSATGCGKVFELGECWINHDIFSSALLRIHQLQATGNLTLSPLDDLISTFARDEFCISTSRAG